MNPLLGQKKFTEILLGRKTRPRRRVVEQAGERGESKRDRRMYYDAWYLEPGQWAKRFHRQVVVGRRMTGDR